MKIVLPKTLAEPGTIPWASMTSGISDVVYHINMRLYVNFKDMEKSSVLPSVTKDSSYRFSVEQVCRILKELAMQNGANWATVYDFTIADDKFKKVGYSFQVRYTVLGDTTRYDKWLYTR